MTQFVKRPPAILNPGNGLLRNDKFQMAYATNDMDRACEIFSKHYGVSAFQRLEGDLPQGGRIRVELAWAGGVMYELMQAQGKGADFCNTVLPSEGFAIRHHHLGYFIHDRSAWEALTNEIEKGGWKIVNKSDSKGFLQAYIIDVPELGHYLEYIFPEPAGVSFFENVPTN